MFIATRDMIVAIQGLLRCSTGHDQESVRTPKQEETSGGLGATLSFRLLCSFELFLFLFFFTLSFGQLEAEPPSFSLQYFPLVFDTRFPLHSGSTKLSRALDFLLSTACTTSPRLLDLKNYFQNGKTYLA